MGVSFLTIQLAIENIGLLEIDEDKDSKNEELRGEIRTYRSRIRAWRRMMEREGPVEDDWLQLIGF